MQDLSKRYWRIKYSLKLIEFFYTLIILFLFLTSGFSKVLSEYISSYTQIKYIKIAIYFGVVYLIYAILNFGFHFYESFVLEHRFGLSRQRFSDWLKDLFKAGVLFYIISLILIEFFYFSLNLSPKSWWLWVSAFWIFLSIILAKLLPIFIIPLFFKYRKLKTPDLRNRIIGLAEKMKIKVLDIFEIDFSKKTSKASACFVGLGKTKRVILADTLRDRYTDEEIEVILAHEFAHYRLAHLWKLLFLEAMIILGNFYLIFKTSGYFLKKYGFLSLGEVASLPIIFIYLLLWDFFTTPFKNFISRILERNADTSALKATERKEAFISLMEKLAVQNIADRNPCAIVKFLFFDHPPIEERIRLARNYN